jgi:tetratricopeptide (TPR) repeat protein
MYFRSDRISLGFFVITFCFFLGVSTPPASARQSSVGNIMVDLTRETDYKKSDMDVYVTGPNGAALQGSAIVTVLQLNGEFVDQQPTKNGYTRFNGLPAHEYKIQVVAPKYESNIKNLSLQEHSLGKISFELQPLSAEDAAASAGFYALPPRIQKDVGKALEALRANKPNDALHPLQAAEKNAPNNAEIEYLFGLYASQLKNDLEARAHWMKALELNPKHLGALLSVGNDLVQQKKSDDAVPYLKRAVDVEPASWRAHVLLSEALLMQKQNDQAVSEAQRAIELGHERAATAQVVLAHALSQKGDRDKAIQALEIYLKAHPNDSNAAKDLETLRNPAAVAASLGADTNAELEAAAADAAALPMATNWRPADVDDHIPAVEPGAACALNDVVQKAGDRLTELVTDVDRFAATESFTHETISKWGVPSPPEKRKFDYVVGIEVLEHKYLNVEEYRNAGTTSASDFPDGVATNGLPAMVLIFHPFNAPNFDMSCEGLARLSSGLAWQVHFKQRPDKPNLIKRYRIGADGISYPVALKGRAWIAADTYQIVRLESDIVAPIPAIRLAADHTEIEYGPVLFQGGKISMWLPQSADVYYDWRGRRIHRRHSFSNYMLFGVDEKQKISAPKMPKDDSAADSAPATPTPKP